MDPRSLLIPVLPVMSLLALLWLPAAHSSVAASSHIPQGYRTVASQHQVPAEVLFAVALAESGRTVNKVTVPWPWTLNVAGKSYRYATRAEGCQALTRFMRTHPLKRIDVGLGRPIWVITGTTTAVLARPSSPTTTSTPRHAFCVTATASVMAVGWMRPPVITARRVAHRLKPTGLSYSATSIV